LIESAAVFSSSSPSLYAAIRYPELENVKETWDQYHYQKELDLRARWTEEAIKKVVEEGVERFRCHNQQSKNHYLGYYDDE